MMLRALILAVVTPALILTGCSKVPEAQRLNPAPDALPMHALPELQHPPAATRSNADIVRDFMELSDRMESGRPIPLFTRFDGPVTVGLAGNVPPSAAADLDHLLARLRREAGIPITRTNANAASITVEFLSRAALQAVVPQAACFVVPNVASWAEFRRARNTSRVDWAALSSRTRAAVFIPNDTSPQEMRDCLHEEIAQALGPLNDLYRLTDSIFNDDNFQTVLTSFDMLMLRIAYAPELQSGMSQQQVAEVLPDVVARLHPAGAGIAGHVDSPTPRNWKDAIESALAAKGTATSRLSDARRAVAIAQAEGWADSRLAFSLFVLGRLSISTAPDVSARAFADAGRIYQSIPGSTAQLAHVDLQLSAFALATGRADEALALTNRSLLTLSGTENAALIASLMLIKSEALDKLGRPSEARAVRLDSRAFARYGFGPENEVRARQSEIAALASSRG